MGGRCQTNLTIAVMLAGSLVFGTPLQSLAHEKPDGPHGYGMMKRGAKFWIGDAGPTGPVFTGPHQFPFICTTFENGLGQPLVDNQDGIGNAVFPEIGDTPVVIADPVGYSKNCSIPTRVDYFYYSTTINDFLPLPDPNVVPADVKEIEIDGRLIKFVVRLERGTINRFIYGIAMLAPFSESLDSPKTLDNAAWNGKLVYKFQGGTGIGHQQGEFSRSESQALHLESLERGFAVAYSTGTKTSTHYNLRLAEETALMVKAHFIATYGKPEYTVGVGGSGGAIQQYVIGQNNPHVIDAAIPQLSYPDMITQTIYVGDCDLLERYFDLDPLLDPASRWGKWSDRGLVEGLATNDQAIPFLAFGNDPWRVHPFASPENGSSECVNDWRVAWQVVLNPALTDPRYFEALALYRYPQELINSIKWTHWNDLGNIYPQDEDGVAPNTWDNVGVQYGLRALVNGDITPEEFLDLNACVGGWKQPQEMLVAHFPWIPDLDLLATWDPWDQLNMNLDPSCKSGFPAPRTRGSRKAMRAAYRSGHVFTGRLDIPIIDIRWYLDPILDMHHSQASFASRARMIAAKGHAKNQVIWFAECELDEQALDEVCPFDPTGRALDVMDLWMAELHGRSARQVVKRKPPEAVDTCFTLDMNDDGISGENVWAGILDDDDPGPCTEAFPIFSTPRIAAGGSIRDDIFKCGRKSVRKALADGTYGDVEFSSDQEARLAEIFPTGVCDYSKPDAGRPKKQTKHAQCWRDGWQACLPHRVHP
jgi:hypothetical protein